MFSLPIAIAKFASKGEVETSMINWFCNRWPQKDGFPEIAMSFHHSDTFIFIYQKVFKDDNRQSSRQMFKAKHDWLILSM